MSYADQFPPSLPQITPTSQWTSTNKTRGRDDEYIWQDSEGSVKASTEKRKRPPHKVPKSIEVPADKCIDSENVVLLLGVHDDSSNSTATDYEVKKLALEKSPANIEASSPAHSTIKGSKRWKNILMPNKMYNRMVHEIKILSYALEYQKDAIMILRDNIVDMNCMSSGNLQTNDDIHDKLNAKQRLN